MSDHLTTKGYKLEWIQVRNLAVIWPEAQRKYDERWARKIADQFDPDKFNPVKVTLPNSNGIYHICEGQHGVRAVEMLWGPDETVPCLVANEADPKRAAEIFLDTNSNRKSVNRISKFQVAVTAERPDEVNITKIVQHCGYRVDGSHAKDTIAAVEALRHIYRLGPKTLDRTLHVLRSTWGSDPAAVASPIIKGYGVFIVEFDGLVDWNRLHSVMKKEWTPGNLVSEAKATKKTLTHLSGTTEAVVYLLLKTYNTRLPRGTPALKRKPSK